LSRSWKIIFFILLTLAVLDIGIEIYAYSISDTIKVVSLIATWSEAKQALLWYTLSLFVLNFLAYKMAVFDTAKNQIVNGMLACSVLALLYFSVSRMLLPYLFFAQVGRLDLFLI
jgi:uncharacterized membrane protein